MEERKARDGRETRRKHITDRIVIVSGVCRKRIGEDSGDGMTSRFKPRLRAAPPGLVVVSASRRGESKLLCILCCASILMRVGALVSRCRCATRHPSYTTNYPLSQLHMILNEHECRCVEVPVCHTTRLTRQIFTHCT